MRLAVVFAIVVSIVALDSARAGTREDCVQSANNDSSLVACSAVIAASPAAWAYANRGNAYARKGQYDQAIADYGVLVAYSAREGQVADDGTGTHSPFAQALLDHLEEPGLELNLLFRKVRDKVIKATQHRDRNDPKLQGPQEPYTYGSLPGEPLYFKPATK
jgi:uncharacterized caspase-like protein